MESETFEDLRFYTTQTKEGSVFLHLDGKFTIHEIHDILMYTRRKYGRMEKIRGRFDLE